MPGQRSLAKLFSYSSIIVISLLTLIVCVVSISSKYRNFNSKVNEIENKFYSEQLDIIKSKVNEIIEYIDYNKSLAEEVLKEDIKRRVQEAYKIALSLYENNRIDKDKNEIKKIIKDALRPVRFNKERGYYFIDDLNSYIILYPPEMGLEDKPAPGNSLASFIKFVKSQDEGFTYYNWYKPDQKEIMNKKITYLKLFEPYKWIIGTGEYLDEVEKDIQEKVIKRIKNTRFGRDGKYCILMNAILNREGGKKFIRTLVNPKSPHLVGQYISDTFTGKKGNSYLEEIVKKCLVQGEAVTDYWEKTGSATPLKNISYSRLYKGWDWIVSSGFNPADLEKIIARNKINLRNTVRHDIILIIAAFFLILLFAVLISNYFSKNIKNEFAIFADFFKDSAKKNELLDKEKLKVTEFRELAYSANKMIGDKKTGEEALRKAKEMAEAATRLKSEFLANVSHEIRTPMNAIIGMSEILAQTELKEDQQEYLEIINSSSINLLGIINDILDVSKMESGKIVLDKKNFKTWDVIEDTTRMIALEAHDKQLELIVSIDPNIPGELTGDPSRLHQILLNLLNNAVKFTEQGEISLSVDIEKDRKNDIVLSFKVRDTGIGISEEGKRVLFKPFSQIDATLTRRYEGAGLGLAISKRLTELMNGEIGVESRYGSGSTFRFTAQFKKVRPGKVSERKPAAPSVLKDLKILIVDTNQTTRSALRKYLEYWGITCEEAGNALEAFSKLQFAAKENLKFDLALIDYHMPEISGVQIAKMIRGSSEIKETKLALLALPARYKESEKASVDGVLHKPVRRHLLYDCITDAMKSNGKSKKKSSAVSLRFIDKMKIMMDKPLNILLVEDNYFNQKVIVHNMEKFGHHVEIANNGKIGIEKYKEGKYDLILMDVQMPVMDGYEATGSIRRLERRKGKKSGQDCHIPIIAMTAHITAEDEIRSLKSGMDAHLTKPFNVEKFINTIAGIIDSEAQQE
jgi:signal transduction histidine kinase/DNA-binding response OmpR family regulator